MLSALSSIRYSSGPEEREGLSTPSASSKANALLYSGAALSSGATGGGITSSARVGLPAASIAAYALRRRAPAISAGTVYVVSYLAPAGFYSADNGFFAGTGVTRSLPRASEKRRNSSVTRAQTTCRPASSL